ncbi:MAG: Gfo/Idh/MocA family oxidoreductase [Opitutaceae bacterium]|nr:Gfo/Idh/MocA family oxidoreductase [Opitutaceae bacterium]
MKTAFKKVSDIKVGVVGYGGAFNMGRMHLQDMAKAGMTPCAVAEPDAARLAIAAQEFPGIQTYANVDEMLKKSDVNLVVLITPHNTHAPLALKCLKAGRHVVCEKPFAITTEECDAMIAAAKKAGVMVSTFHNRHWDGSIMRALEVVRSGMLGEIVRIEAHMGGWSKPGDWWRGSKSISGGILYDWGVHLLEYALQVVDSDVVEVTGFAKAGYWSAQSKWGQDTVEDEAQAVIRFKSGVWVTLTISHIDPNPKRGMMEITGTKGSFLWEYDHHEITVKQGEVTTVTKAKNPPEQWAKYYENIAAHLSKGERLVISPEWARRTIHILDLAGQSARVGRTIKAKYA